MQVKRFFAADMRQAMKLVRDELGADAAIIGNRRIAGGVELTAALDYKPQALAPRVPNMELEDELRKTASRIVSAQAELSMRGDSDATTNRQLFAGLPLTAAEEDRLYVHASADAPDRWHYVHDARAAGRSFAATGARLIVCGHTHVPAIFYARAGHWPVAFAPLDNQPAPLIATRRHLVVAGSVGQPRDGNPAACFALIDLGQGCVTMRRVPYDAEATARKVLAAGLPARLATRLVSGR